MLCLPGNPYRKKAVLTTEARRAQAQLVLGDAGSERQGTVELCFSSAQLSDLAVSNPEDPGGRGVSSYLYLLVACTTVLGCLVLICSHLVGQCVAFCSEQQLEVHAVMKHL